MRAEALLEQANAKLGFIWQRKGGQGPGVLDTTASRPLSPDSGYARKQEVVFAGNVSSGCSYCMSLNMLRQRQMSPGAVRRTRRPIPVQERRFRRRLAA
ncbi:hypothetical protein DSL92_01750 [Billgrantia gudaonensis]|uniref:Uncharacterized protein n=1 Tax=Billgrantia gudaonensis TaxID=376427 RepID=A0A432JK93_9GAMM|nr:hypothetical protein DSL92_01750 [Halomonas gudaonensis]